MARMARREDDDYDYPEGLTSTRAWWDAREAKMAKEIAEDLEYARSPEGRAEAAYRRLQAMEFAHSDHGRYADEEIAAAQAEYDARQAEVAGASEAAFSGEWTLEVTVARRAEWNARVQKGEFGRVGGGRIDAYALRAAEDAQGWTHNELGRAVKLHHLGGK